MPEESTQSTTSGPETAEQLSLSKRTWRRGLWLIAVILLLSGGVLLSQRQSGSAAGGRGQRGRGGGGAIPVSVATVTQGNMGDYISALGTVTSVYTVTVTSRVAGALVAVHYREGQVVHKGDLLAVIDPRPYEATYLQAEGQLERDRALLANARSRSNCPSACRYVAS
jgi:multidrug efflux system membrane fusion protein